MSRPPRIWEFIAMALEREANGAEEPPRPEMGRTIIEVEAEDLTDVVPLICSVATVLGSAASRNPGCVALEVEGLAIPQCERARVVFTRRYFDDGAAALVFRFLPFDA